MNNFKKLKTFFSLACSISPLYIGLLILNSLIASGQILLNVILPKYLVDELVGAQNIEILIIFGLAIVLSNLIFAFLGKTMKKFLEVRNIYVEEMMNQEMAKKIMNVEFSHLENPYYLDLKERAVFAIGNQRAMSNIISSVSTALNNIITITGLVIIMMTLSPILVVLLILTILLSLFIYKQFMDYQVNFFQELIPVNRKYGYYVGLSFDDKIQKDIRLYGMNDMLINRVTEYNIEMNSWFSSYYKKQGFYLGLYGVINDLQAALAYGYVALRVLTNAFGGRIGIGSFTMYVNAAINFSRSTVELGDSLIRLMQTLNYLEPFMEFMSLPDEEMVDESIEFEGDIETIEFRNVSFSYPGSDIEVLKDISFKINQGEKISIVGLNGAGKTTLVKLICRLYQPKSGEILINGHNIFDYEHKSYMEKIAAVFQDYKLFAFSLDENITCDEVNINTERTMELIEEVGLQDKIENLPNGLASLYGKAYDESGIEMSGGESQKVAIARALYKDASLLILDEPTSALDPLAEADIYENFNKMVGGKTAIYISHRMSSSIFCDKILIIDDGEVIDYDRHRNLLEKKDGLYYKLFNSQSVNYQY